MTGFDLRGLDWYIAFAFFKLAVIFEGIHFRYVQGLTVGGDYDYVAPIPRRSPNAGWPLSPEKIRRDQRGFRT